MSVFFLGDKNTKICGTGSSKCYRNAEKKLFGEDIIDDFQDDSVKLFRSQCNCLPACTSIKYDAVIDRTKFDYSQTSNDLTSFDIYVKRYNKSTMDYFRRHQMSRISVFFMEPQVTTFRRNESQTYTDFLAICGGLLGLFLGVSALSIIEFIYYSTLRLFWNIRSWNESDVVPFKKKVTTIDNIELGN